MENTISLKYLLNPFLEFKLSAKRAVGSKCWDNLV